MTACMIQMSPMQSRKQSGRWPENEALGVDIYSLPRSLYPRYAPDNVKDTSYKNDQNLFQS